jgi:hypothetical protein
MIEAESDQMIEEGQPSLEHSGFIHHRDGNPENNAVANLRVVGAPPNWREKIDLAKRQERLLLETTRAIEKALWTLDNEIYATRVVAAREYLEDALSELDDYKREDDPNAYPETDKLMQELRASVQATCKHPDKIMHASGSTPDTNEAYRCYHCEKCHFEWVEYE